jgi:methionyl-tRNA formyltransferase
VPQALTIAFAGTPAFAVPTLESLLKSRHRVAVVYTQPDRPAGRGRQLHISPVKECALRHGLPVEQPVTLRTEGAADTLSRYQIDVMIVVAYGLLLPKAVLSLPRFGCLNIHASLLPRWRGAAPIQRAVLAGDPQTGVCIMRMEEGLDTGPVYLERMLDIGSRDTAGTLHDRLADLGAAALLQALEGVIAGTLEPHPQPAAGVTYARKILKEEAVIDWSRPAQEIDRRVRAFNPTPVAETLWRGQQLRVWEAAPDGVLHGAAPGTVVSADADGIVVAAGEGALRLQRIQLAGRKPTSAADFLNAHSIAGDCLGTPAPDQTGLK